VPKTGDVFTGKVVTLLDKGAIVKINERETGFVHISEVSTEFVKNIRDHLKVGQEVKVRVIKVDRKRGKIALSIKKADSEVFKKIDFENKMKRFLEDSSEKLRDLQRSTESKQGIKPRKAPKKK
jgi:S1 RNA binding domain protein